MDHATGGTGHSSVVVQHAQDECFQHHCFLKFSLHAEDGGAGEIQFTLGIAANGPAEAIRLEPVESVAGDNGVGFQETELFWSKPELGDSVEQARGARDNAIAASGRQVPGEDLENGSPVAPP